MMKKILSLVLFMLFFSCLTSVACAENVENFPSVWTDEPDYAPGETVLIIGSGFKPYSQVTISVSKPDLSVDIVYADTNEAGNFSCYYGPVWTEGDYKVTVTDGVNTAETTFTDCYVLIRMYYSEDHKPFSDEVCSTGYDYVVNPGKFAYIVFYNLDKGEYYKVEFSAKKGTEFVMAYEFTAEGTSQEIKVKILDSGPLSADGQYWVMRLYKKQNGVWGSCIASRNFWVAALKLYKDSAHTIPTDIFLPDDTVYIVGEGFKPITKIKISYYYKTDSSVVKIFGPYVVTTDSHGVFTTSFTCTELQGEWIILARWSTWCWCPSQYYKTESFFVVPEVPLGTVSATAVALLGLALYKGSSKGRRLVTTA